MGIIYDMSNIAYTGTAYQSYRPLKNEYSNNILSYMLQYVTEITTSEHEHTFLVFDPKPKTNNKVKSLSDYKGGRNHNRDVMISIETFVEMLEELELPFYRGKYEADDYIYDIAKKLREWFPEKSHTIVSADADLYNCIYSNEPIGYSTGVRVISPNKDGKCITHDNFEYLLNYPCNITDVVKTIQGCKSDKITPIPNHKHILNDYIQMINDKEKGLGVFADKSKYNDKEVLFNFIEEKYPEVLNKVKENAILVYPRDLDINIYAFNLKKLCGLAEYLLGPSDYRKPAFSDIEPLTEDEKHKIDIILKNMDNKLQKGVIEFENTDDYSGFEFKTLEW